MSALLDGLDVLVVEDDEDSRDLFALALRESGAIVRTATTAKGALAALREECPDLLIADISMPDDDGYALLRSAHALHPALAAIAVTGHAASKDVQRALDAGYRHHLSKPVEIEDLVAAVFRFASRREG